MEIEEAQKQAVELITEINNKLNVKHDPDTIFLHLAEEIGEVARELSKKQKNWREEFDRVKLADELADVMLDIFVIANDNNIDLSKSFINKINKARIKFEIN